MGNYFKNVYAVALQIPKGKVATFGQIATILGNPKSARVVGWAMHSAPDNMNIYLVIEL